MEALMTPLTISVLAVGNLVLVLAYRFRFANAFSSFGAKRIARGYGAVVLLCIALGIAQGGGQPRVSFFFSFLGFIAGLPFVSLAILPLTLRLESRGKASVTAVFLAGLGATVTVGLAMVWQFGPRHFMEIGAVQWVADNGAILGFYIAVSAVFSLSTRTP